MLLFTSTYVVILLDFEIEEAVGLKILNLGTCEREEDQGGHFSCQNVVVLKAEL